MPQIIQHKRSTTINNPPATLAEGELAVGMTDAPPSLWVGTPGGVKQVNPGVVEAPVDGKTYSRQDAGWVPTTKIVETLITASSTYTKNPAARYIEVWAQGGGGGGGGAAASPGNTCVGAGGGGGGCAYNLYAAATLAASVACTIGSSGVAGAGTGSANGGAGGTTTFGALLTGEGGTGGIGSPNDNIAWAHPGSPGGDSSGGSMNFSGGQGYSAMKLGGASTGHSGGGGMAGVGGGGRGVGTPGSTGGPGIFGSGGGGGYSLNGTGASPAGAGGKGYIRIREYF